jgi:outer membrane immunogenic protein
MKKLLLATSALVVAGPALGADIPVPAKAPMIAAVAPLPYSWTGCYIGAQAGYGWGRTDVTDPAPFFGFANGQTTRASTRGGLVGGQVGCDYQFAGGWVVGLEGDIAWADIKGTVDDPFFAGKNFSSKTEWIATGTGRIGYSFDRVLFYGKGGAAWAHNRFDMTFFGGVPASASETRFGWTVGAGIEYMLAPNWSAKLEYNHYDFGSRQISLTGTGLGGAFVTPENISQRIDTVKVGLNYRFWSAPGAVVARY